MPFWKNKRVLITGHTGFKGSWLSLWLQKLEADICGYSLKPPTTPSLFKDADAARGMRSVIADIRDLKTLRRTVIEWKPEIVIHMAAQPLVRSSYEDPIETYAINVMGTANLLEALRGLDTVRSVVVITTDKCYENREWPWGYRETDTLGGYDPYSNSKACAELVVSAYRNSFFNPARYNEHGVAVATARAGNVIGGGDWAKDRLVPDLMRAFLKGKPVEIHNPRAVRPWQHVLDPLRGYLQIAERLVRDGACMGEAWNFGPEFSDARTVESIVDSVATAWGNEAKWEIRSSGNLHESQLLRLDWSRAAEKLGWRPILRLDDALRMTVDWYKAYQRHAEMHDFTMQQIAAYESRGSHEFRGGF